MAAKKVIHQVLDAFSCIRAKGENQWGFFGIKPNYWNPMLYLILAGFYFLLLFGFIITGPAFVWREVMGSNSGAK